MVAVCFLMISGCVSGKNNKEESFMNKWKVEAENSAGYSPSTKNTDIDKKTGESIEVAPVLETDLQSPTEDKSAIPVAEEVVDIQTMKLPAPSEKKFNPLSFLKLKGGGGVAFVWYFFPKSARLLVYSKYYNL